MGSLSVLDALGGIAIAVMAVIGSLYGLVRLILKIGRWLDVLSTGVTGTGKRLDSLERMCEGLQNDLREEVKQRREDQRQWRGEARELFDRLQRLEERVFDGHR